MIEDLYCAAAIATIVVVLCTSDAGLLVRSRWNPLGVFDCHFCTSIWVSAVIVPLVSTSGLWLRIPAVAAVANVFILLIHLSIGTVSNEILSETETENPAG